MYRAPTGSLLSKVKLIIFLVLYSKSDADHIGIQSIQEK